MAERIAENEALQSEIMKLKHEKKTAVDEVVVEKLVETERLKADLEASGSSLAEKNVETEALKSEITQLKHEKEKAVEKVTAEKLVETERLKAEVNNLKKTAEDNLNIGSDAKIKRQKNICLKMENEKKKLIDDPAKEKSDILIAKMKVEESLTTTKKLQVKDDTYTGIFDCVKELLKKFETNNGDEINANPPEERDGVRNNAERDIRNAEHYY